MTLYNLTELTNADTMGALLTYTNNATDGYLILFFVISIFFILLMTLKRYDFAEALLTSGFISFVISLILSYGGFLNIIYPIGFLVISAITALIVFGFNKN